jgi:hypothetical protein
LLALVLVMLIPSVPVYRRLCAAPASAFPVLAAARDGAAREAAVRAGVAAHAQEDVRARLAAAAARWKADALRTLVAVKQSDAVAFPLHAVMGLALEAGPCPLEVAGDQWRKAAQHCGDARCAPWAAAGLSRTWVAALGREETDARLAQFAQEMPWDAAKLARVRGLL